MAVLFPRDRLAYGVEAYSAPSSPWLLIRDLQNPRGGLVLVPLLVFLWKGLDRCEEKPLKPLLALELFPHVPRLQREKEGFPG